MHRENALLFDIVEKKNATGGQTSAKRSNACVARKPKRRRDQPTLRTAGWVARPTQWLSALTTLGRVFS